LANLAHARVAEKDFPARRCDMASQSLCCGTHVGPAGPRYTARPLTGRLPRGLAR